MGIGFPTNHWLSYDWPLCLYPSVVPTGPAPWTRRWSPCPAKQRGRWPSSQWGTPQTRPTLTGSLSATWTYPPVTCLVSRAWESHQGTVSRMLHRDQLQKILLYPNVTVSVDFNDADSSWHSKLNHAVAFSILTKSHHLNYIPLTYLLLLNELLCLTGPVYPQVAMIARSVPCPTTLTGCQWWAQEQWAVNMDPR